MFYRGKEGQWSWIFHRLTGVGVLLFLITHILDTMLVWFGPNIYNRVIMIYRHPLFKFAEIGLFAAVLYHSLNGIRIILIDFWPAGTRHHKQMFYIEITVFVLAMAVVTTIMMGH